MTILFQSALFILTAQDYPFLKTCIYLELTQLQVKDSLHLLVYKCGLQYQTLLPPLPSNGNFKNTS